jgi:hypothetical protein
MITLAKEQGYDAETKAGTIVEWLEQEFGLGRAHAMALVDVIKHGAQDQHQARRQYRRSSRQVRHATPLRHREPVTPA